MTRRPALPPRRWQDGRFQDAPKLSAVRGIMGLLAVTPVIFAAGAMIRFHIGLTVTRERFLW